MATRRYKVSVGKKEQDVVSEVGAAVNSDTVEVTIELASTAINANGTTRTVSREEVLEALLKIENKILKEVWPPA